MHLRSVTLRGFKSFADRSQLAFEPGVTVVVGPNGSGKSNIADAVLWVLGEQSAKALRGQAMEDVIFAGSAGRQAVGVAEVELVLDNSDGRLPLEFSEVTVARRMYRSGESEYLLNQSPCRLMDIQELLHDTGLGRDTHSIISQGRIDEVLNSRPEDRRALIEEAAGVLKHKRRRERAMRKLTALDTHLQRVRDVLGEIDRQLRPLERQAGRAARHAEFAQRLHELEVSLAADELGALQADWDAVEKREREEDAEVEILRFRLSEKEQDLTKFQSVLEEKGLFVGDISEQRRRMQSILERLNAGLLLLEEKGKNLVDRLSDLRAKMHQTENRRAKRAAELESIVGDRRETDSRLKALYSRLGELRKEAEAAKKRRLAAEEALNDANGLLRRTKKEIEDARTDAANLEQALSSLSLEEGLLRERADSVRQQRSSIVTSLSGRRSRLEQVDDALSMGRKESALAHAEVDKRVRVVESRKRELAERREQLAGVRAEVRGLEEVTRAFESASPALAWAMSRERDLPGLIGPLVEHVQANPEVERLVEHALGGDLFALLVEDGKAAERVADVLRRNSAGDVTIMPVDQVPARHSVPAAAGVRLADGILCEEKARSAIEALIGDVYVVDTLDEALKAAREDGSASRFATRSGEIVWPTGKITLGPMQDPVTGVLTRKRRANELRDEADALSFTVGEAEAALGEAEAALDAAQQDSFELGQRAAAMTGERESLAAEIGRLEAALNSADEDERSVAGRLAEVGSRLEKERPGRESAQRAINELVSRESELDETVHARRDERDVLLRDENTVAERLAACQVEIATVSEREVHLKRNHAALSAEVKELDEAVEQSAATEEALELLRDRIEPLHALYDSMLERAEHWGAKLRDRASLERADSESLRGTIHEVQDAIRSLQGELEEHVGTRGATQVEKAQLEIQVRSAAERIVEELGVPLERALDNPPLEDRDSTIAECRKIRDRIDGIGPVNAAALQEYEALKSRRDFIGAQVDDVAASRSAIQRIIGAIDRKMRDRFLETFEQVDSHFQEVFSVLFPGGRASLALTEPDDPESTGVEVVAQPLGKRLSKMTLMSGGEKSLTALALLFAVYRTRPCPFYVLDEVEAALDDVNLRRFIAFVDSLRSRTQFVVVTHQRRTMEMADVLYGVSMHADGVSKVVSQRLDRSAAALEASSEHAVV